jgi:kynurenine formamidase
MSSVKNNLSAVQVSTSDYGPEDQIGALNRMSPASQAAILQRADGSKVYDLSVDYFLGMPSFQAAGDPPYQIWMTHTPRGTRVDNANGAGDEVNRSVCYSGDVILMYTHTGTHIDALNHFGMNGSVFNDSLVDDHLGSRHWFRNGADQLPPIIARGVLLDIAGLHGVECLSPSYGITSEDCEQALEREGVELGEGDVALVRTGRMAYWPDADRVMGDSPGMSLEGARWLTDKGVVAVGADNEAVEQTPSQFADNWLPGHCHFLAEAGVPIMELLDLESLARDEVYEFCFIGAPIRLQGATGSPLRPLAMPILQAQG